MDHDFSGTKIDVAEESNRVFTMSIDFPMESELVLPTRIKPRRSIHVPSIHVPLPICVWKEASIRALDIALSLVLLMLLSSVMVFVALLIAATDGAPVIFAHHRVGKRGKPFRCYKFRTMGRGAEASLTSLLSQDSALAQEWAKDQKLACDPRVTWLGHFLRISSIDELPQLFNVLKGEMSMVGPRPIVTDELARYGRYADHYLSVKPGITGLWQVNRRNHSSYRRRVAFDVLFVRTRSLPLIMIVLLATAPAVFLHRGSF